MHRFQNETYSMLNNIYNEVHAPPPPTNKKKPSDLVDIFLVH